MCYVMAKRLKNTSSPSSVAKALLKEFNELKETDPHTYEFSLIISKPNLRDNIAAYRLYQNGCTDALFSVSNGMYRVDFNRKALSLEDVINSAISNITDSDIGSHIVGIKLHLGHGKL